MLDFLKDLIKNTRPSEEVEKTEKAEEEETKKKEKKVEDPRKGEENRRRELIDHLNHLYVVE